jgi:exodeoxyribonuclease V beta subunit
LLAPLETRDDFETLRADHAAFVLSSYSRMKRAKAGERTAAVELADRDRSPAREAELEPRGAADGPREDALPGGVATGRFVHEVLEHVAFVRARDVDAGAFAADPEVARLLDTRARLHGIDARHVPEAARMVHAALTTRLDLGGVTLDGLCRLESSRVVKEMEFLYPIPERDHPPLGAEPPARGFEIQRGYLRGFVDLVFEHAGRIWFADWKTDVLDDYRAETLDAHVDENYGIQKTVYAVALARWLGARDADAWERRFGGVFYVFLRGVGAGEGRTDGIWSTRPAWAEIQDEVEWLRRFHPYRETRHGG